MESQKLSLLAYTSIASHHMTHEELLTLLSQSRKNNLPTDITGMLLYMEGCFFQVLEGEADQLEKLFDKISKDPRHHDLMKLILEPIETRSFSNWSMGFQHITKEELTSITGLTDFLDRENNGFEGLEITRARKLIEFFREGRWFRKDLTQYKRISMGV
jgi:Sensors of blue-light using FAD